MRRALISLPWRWAAFNYTDCFQLPAGRWAARFQLHPHRKWEHLSCTVTSFQLLCFNDTTLNLRTTTLTRCKQFAICTSHTMQLLSPSNVVRRRGVRLLVNLVGTGKALSMRGKDGELLWEDGKDDEKSIRSLAVRQCFLTCIHRTCRRSCLGTLRRDEDLLFLLLLTTRREEINDFHKRWLEVSDQVANYPEKF